ncbi:MAG: beta-N-acetylhexosaminidase [Bacteroidales bacterium]|jgi:hexosaminidase|nr:beta-N-acetylhexosaminidase [Bacteroidales bacterium]
MNKLIVTSLICSLSLASFAQNSYNIVPKPVKLKAQQGKFVFNSDTRIVVPEETIDLQNALFALQERFLLTKVWHLKIEKATENMKPADNTIFIKFNPAMTNQEAYKLRILKTRIEIEAGAAPGVFYAMQTLRQLLPPEIERNQTPPATLELSVPCAEIEDTPRYAYRGILLDVCRHFSNVRDVKHYINMLAFHKINTFHWHLTDDQGWRIEIKKYPKLAEISAWRDRTLIGSYTETGRKYEQRRYGGYYTQEEIKEVVAYAKTKFITVIPEIELPGHAMAALAAYPEFSCTGGPFEVSGLWGIFNDVYCPKDITFQFWEDVLSEVISLFPSKYIHIGGDECPKVRWERCHHCQTKMKELGLKDEHALQSYVISRIEKFVSSKGRSIIGWDEILEGGLADNATVMSWRGLEGGIAAARQGHDVIMTPTSFCYLDYYQSEDKKSEPLAIGGFLPLEKVYSFDPTPAQLTTEEAKHILGGQANLWTEYIPTRTGVEYMLFPRMAALSEAVWTNKEGKNFDDFKNRLKNGTVKHYDALDVTYSKSNLK